MLKFLTGVTYTIAVGFACVVAYQHTQDIPVVSGWLAFATMIIVPQIAVAMVFNTFRAN